MQSRLSAIAGKTAEVLKSFIVLGMKTMFRGGASGQQIASFLGTYVPDQPELFQGKRLQAALDGLERDGILRRAGYKWYLAAR
jgi:hypothetical protein